MRVVALASIAGLVAGPASADWQNTRWGMAPAQAQQIVNGRAASPTEAQNWSLRGVPAAVVFEYRSGNMSFVGTLYFGDAKGGLSKVRLELTDPARQSDLLAALRQHYGKPAEEHNDPHSHWVVWNTATEQVQFLHQRFRTAPASVTVTYIAQDR